MNTSLTTTELLSDLTPQELLILEKRARELAHHEQAQVDAGLILPVLTFRLAGETYAIPVEAVREVRPLKRLTRVPFAPDFILGVINLRGSILSLIDMRKFLGISGQAISDLMITIIVESAGLEMGILVQKVHEVTLMQADRLTAPPATINGVDAEFIKGVSSEGVILLNLKRIISDPRMIVNESSF